MSNLKHGNCVGGFITREYATWRRMKQRCYNVFDPYYKDYGGRGITVCKEWLDSFMVFYIDMGEIPEGTTLGRIDNNGNYCKDNCRWETPKEQANNRRSNRLLTFNGVTRTMANGLRKLE
jgi:hypothetical protein